MFAGMAICQPSPYSHSGFRQHPTYASEITWSLLHALLSAKPMSALTANGVTTEPPHDEGRTLTLAPGLPARRFVLCSKSAGSLKVALLKSKIFKPV